MNKYTLYCTEAQTKKAFKLGAPIKMITFARPMDGQEIVILDGDFYCIPTAGQMIGWLRSKNILFRFDDEEDYWSICDANDVTNEDSTPLRRYSWTENKELRAIDAALEYLENKK